MKQNNFIWILASLFFFFVFLSPFTTSAQSQTTDKNIPILVKPTTLEPYLTKLENGNMIPTYTFEFTFNGKEVIDHYFGVDADIISKAIKEKWNIYYPNNKGDIYFVKAKDEVPCIVVQKKCDLAHFCNELQRNSPVKPVDISTEDRPGGGFVFSAHFNLSGVPNQKMADNIIKNAEFYYTNLEKAWFGGRIPTDLNKINLSIVVAESSEINTALTVPRDSL